MSHIRLFRHYVNLPYLLLAAFEGAVFLLAIFGAASIRFFSQPLVLEELGSLWPRAWLFAIVMLLAMMSMGVYQAQGKEGLSGVVLRMAVSFLLGASLLSLVFYIFPSLFVGRGVVALSTLLSFFIILGVRITITRYLDPAILSQRILVLGAGERARQMIDRLNNSEGTPGLKILGFVSVFCESIQIDADHIIGKDTELRELAQRHRIDEIVVAMDDRRTNFPTDDLLDCKLSGIEVVDILTFFERETGRVLVSQLHPSWFVFSDGFAQSSLTTGLVRCCDILVSLMLLFITWPVMLITILAIKIEDGFSAPVFYKQKRVGLNNLPFFVYKFRSMRIDAEKGGAQWAQTNDDRITRVGHIIRKYRIDELPQILNVLRGDMAFVGPRPERPEFVSQLEQKIPYYAERHRVRPGITGWAQLKYPYAATDKDTENKLEFDLYYVKNHSLLLDVLIILQTVEVILFKKGSR